MEAGRRLSEPNPEEGRRLSEPNPEAGRRLSEPQAEPEAGIPNKSEQRIPWGKNYLFQGKITTFGVKTTIFTE